MATRCYYCDRKIGRSDESYVELCVETGGETTACKSCQKLMERIVLRCENKMLKNQLTDRE